MGSFISQLKRIFAGALVPPLIVALISLARWNLTEILGSRAPYALYIFGIILAAQLLGFTAGLYTTLLSAIAGAVLFLPGADIFLAFDEAEVVRVALFIAEGLAISLSSEFLRQARVRARRGETDLRVITDHVPAVIAYVDATETYRFANRGFLDIFEVEPATIIGKNSRDFLTEGSYENVRPHIARALKGERVEYESDLELKNGRRLHVRSSYLPDIDAKGRIRGYFAMVVDETQAHFALLAAKEAQREFKAVLERSSVIYFALDKQGCFTKIEGQALQSLGLDAKKIVGRSYSSLAAEEGGALFAGLDVEAALRGQACPTSETAFGDRTFTTQLSPTPDEFGAQGGIFGIATDVTESKRAQIEKLQISQRLQLAIESGQLGTWEINVETEELLWDARTRALFGVTSEDRITRADFFRLVHPDDRENLKEEMTKGLNPDLGRVSTEYRIVHPVTGEVRWIFGQGRTLFDQEKRPVSVIGTLLDVTQRRRAEAELRLSQERLTLALESARMGTWHWDIDSGLISTSGRTGDLAESLNSDPSKPRDFFETLDRFVHPDDLEQVKEALARALARDGRLKVEFRVVRPDGTVLWTLCRGQASYDRGGRPLSVTGLILDTTEQKRAEAALVHAKEEAERASQMKSAFLANMSHEIRTPLGAMLGFAGFLKDRGLSEEERNRYVDVLTRNGEQLLVLIDDILDFSKVAAGHLSFEILRTKPAQVLDDVMASLSPRASEKGLTLEIKIEDSAPDLIGTDPTRLKQILFNIVGNAVKFTQQGSVSVRVTGTESVAGADQILFEIRDTGIGIPRERADQLFQVFTQADESMTRKFGGTGLGLALSRRLAQGLGGDVTLTSTEPGRGSLFTVTIKDLPVPAAAAQRALETPVAPRTTPAPLPARSPAPPPAAAAVRTGARTKAEKPEQEKPLVGLRILLVEDSEDNRFLINRMISRRGGEVEIARNGEEGVARALASSHDLVLMDIQMPVMDGYTATKQLRAQGYRTPIIALTAHAMSEARTKTLEVGCTDHLTKPVQAPELVAMILRHARQHLEVPAPGPEAPL